MLSDDVLKSIISIIPPVLTLILVWRQNKKLIDIHTLVNSNFGVALKLNALNSRWRANSSRKPEDMKAAIEAENLLYEHDLKQSIVDAGI